MFGGIIVVAGFVGTAAGGILVDRGMAQVEVRYRSTISSEHLCKKNLSKFFFVFLFIVYCLLATHTHTPSTRVPLHIISSFPAIYCFSLKSFADTSSRTASCVWPWLL